MIYLYYAIVSVGAIAATFNLYMAVKHGWP